MSQNVNMPIPGIGGFATTTGAERAGTVFASTSRITGTYNSQEFYNPTARGVRVNLVIAPTGPATGTVTVKLQAIDPVSNSVWTDISGATTAAINGTGALTGTLFTLYPGVVTGASSCNMQLGPRWRAVATVALDTLTFTVGADYLM